MNAPQRRGACPGLSAPMSTGDGLLVRLVPDGGHIGLDGFSALCAAARRHGNGIVEVTARGSIQVRGLTPVSVPAFADTVAMLDIAAANGVPILCDPLAGLDPHASIDASPLAAALRQRVAESGSSALLGPKVSIVIDSGGALHLDAVRADLRLRADGARLHVSVGGDAGSATALGIVAAADAVETIGRLLEVIVRHGRDARAHELVREQGLNVFRAAIAGLVIDAPSPPPRPASEPIGTHNLRDGRQALGVGLAFGHADAAALQQLFEAAAAAGGRGIRTAPTRALLVVGLVSGRAPALAATAERLGFITRPHDPRRHIVACAGAPVCAAAKMPARALGPAISAAAAPLLDGSLKLHISGCAKGCAHPAPAALTLVGSERGCGMIADGCARGVPLGTVAPEMLASRLARLVQELEHARRPGERAADALARLGTGRLATILTGAAHD